MVGNRTTFNILMKSAKAKFDRSDFEGAIADYTAAIERKTDNKTRLAEAYNGRGLAKNEINCREEAIEDYDKAIRLCNEAIDIDPENAKAWNYRGSAKSEIGRSEEAIVDFDEAIRLDPKYALALNNRGFSKYELGRHEEAIKDYDKAIALVSKDKNLLAVLWNNSGIAKSQIGRHEDALAGYDEAIRCNPYYAIAWYNRGLGKDKLGRHEEAIADYTEAIRLNPKKAAAWNNRGWVKSQIGDFDGAVKDIEEAFRLLPKDPKVRNNLAAIKAEKSAREAVEKRIGALEADTDEVKDQAEEYKRKERINLRVAYSLMLALLVVICLLVTGLIVLVLWPECILWPECSSELKPIDLSNPFNLLPWITLIVFITSPVVWLIRQLVAEANSAKIMQAEYRHLAYVEGRMLVYFQDQDTNEGKEVRADYIKTTMTNSPADKLLTLQNKANVPSPNPAQNIVEKAVSKVRNKSTS